MEAGGAGGRERDPPLHLGTPAPTVSLSLPLSLSLSFTISPAVDRFMLVPGGDEQVVAVDVAPVWMGERWCEKNA